MTAIADLSVVMPTYNHALYLPRALQALVSQSVVPREIIVVNDASTDGTAAILESFARDHAMIKVVTNEQNRRTNVCVRIGVQHATGRYLYCTGSDDYVLPGFVEKMVGTLEAHPQAGLCSAYFSIVNGMTGEIRPNVSGWCTEPKFFAPRELEKLIGHTSVPGHASIMRRSSFDAAGGFLPELEWHSDWFLSFVVAFREGLCHVPETLSLLTEMPQTYSSHGMFSDHQLVVLNAIFDRLASASYRDVAGSFQRSGVLSVFGLPVLRAAARRSDVWSKDVLALLNCFSAAEYETLLDDPDPCVHELGQFFVGPFWQEAKKRREVDLAQFQASLAQRDGKLAQYQQTIVDAEGRLTIANQRLAERQDQLETADSLAAELEQRLREIESSPFWKVHGMLSDYKKGVLASFGRESPRSRKPNQKRDAA